MRFPIIFFVFCLLGTSAMAQEKSLGDTLNIDWPDTTVLENAVKKALEDSLSHRLPAIDTTNIKEKVKSKAKEAIEDSLRVKLAPLDTTDIKDKVKATVKSVAKDSLDTYVDIPDITIDSATTDQLKTKAKTRLEQEIGHQIPEDSASVKQEAQQLAKDQLKQQTGIDVPGIKMDSTATAQIEEEAEKKAEEALKNTAEFKALDESDSKLSGIKSASLPADKAGDKIEATRQQLKQKAARKELKQKMASQARQYISQHADQIRQVQGKMGELKKKYSYVPNSNDLSTAKKRTSLKGEPFWKRLVIGGNFSVSNTNPVTIDMSPVLGWKFNKLFEAGITGSYRAKFGAERTGLNTFENEKVYGYSLFANHMVFKNFFGYLEGERISKVTGTEEQHSRKWHQTLLLGIGRKFKIAKFLEMQAIVTYNFLHDNEEGVYDSPVVFKTGFRVVK